MAKKSGLVVHSDKKPSVQNMKSGEYVLMNPDESINAMPYEMNN